ncbi:TPA: hypothetical protein ACGI26_000526 [Staphylococcus argenteus]
MKIMYIILIFLIWLNLFLGNNITHAVIALVVTLYIVNTRKCVKNNRVE